MNTERTITLRKRMAASKCKGKSGGDIQMLGSGYINRWKDGKGSFCSLDALFIEDFLPDLKWSEGEIDVDLTLSPEPFRVWATVKRVQAESLGVSKENR